MTVDKREAAKDMQEDGRLDIRVRIPPEETGYIESSSAEDFAYDAVDGDLLILVEGRSPFASVRDDRIGKNGCLKSIPVVDFMWNLADATESIASGISTCERVAVTSTDYSILFDRRGEEVLVSVMEEKQSSTRLIAETRLSLRQMVHRCSSAADLTYVSVLRSNPRLKRNVHMRGFKDTLERLHARKHS